MNSGDLKTYKYVKISKPNSFTITMLSLHSICLEKSQCVVAIIKLNSINHTISKHLIQINYIYFIFQRKFYEILRNKSLAMNIKIILEKVEQQRSLLSYKQVKYITVILNDAYLSYKILCVFVQQKLRYYYSNNSGKKKCDCNPPIMIFPQKFYQCYL